MEKFTKSLKYCAIGAFGLVLCSFCTFNILADEALYLEKKLTEHYDISQEGPGILSYELQVTNSGFCRYKRHYADGKTDYFSFNTVKFKRMDYSGTNKRGRLFLYTIKDDVIVQTFNDNKGDIDSMATYLSIPLKDIRSADLADLTEKFRQLHLKLQSAQ
ncbi:hypothetical protein [Pedobacter immunditicola]|uniref:hypothetical protein n=1 Tax=Pedobacter immunditicola TaxID=3133440 RepID=UPI0030A75D04